MKRLQASDINRYGNGSLCCLVFLSRVEDLLWSKSRYRNSKYFRYELNHCYGTNARGKKYPPKLKIQSWTEINSKGCSDIQRSGMRMVIARKQEICRCVKIVPTQHTAPSHLRPSIQRANPNKAYDMTEIAPQAKMFIKNSCLWEGRENFQHEVT